MWRLSYKKRSMKPENSFNRVYEFVDKIYEEFDDYEIDAILESLHQDLGREASYFCEVCNPDTSVHSIDGLDKK